MLQKIILHLHFIKSLKRDIIYELCLWIIEEYACFILTHWDVSKLKYGTHEQECILFLYCAESLTHKNIYTVILCL